MDEMPIFFSPFTLPISSHHPINQAISPTFSKHDSYPEPPPIIYTHYSEFNNNPPACVVQHFRREIMGNNMGAGSSKAAKVMKINGELLKLKTPAKVLDVIKDYPNHVLLDSQEFLRFNLRAKPLDPEDEIMPKKVYLLVELPKFPGPLRRVRSVLDVTTAGAATPRKTTQRSISDLSIMNTANLAAANTDSDDSVSIDGESGRARVKMRLPKVQMEKIMKESGDQAEIAQKILQLYLGDSLTRTGGDAVVDGGARGEERESVKEAEVRASCIPHGGYYRRKYKKLTL